MTIRINLNGRQTNIPAPYRLMTALTLLERIDPILVIRNGHPVKRAAWDETVLSDGDHLQIIADQPPSDETTFQALLTARNSPALQTDISDGSAVIIGCGGLGSHVAISLARTGIGSLVLLDDERVDATNLNRQCFDQADIGRSKVEALADHIRRFNPFVKLLGHRERVAPDNLLDLIGDVGIIVEAVDGEPDKAMLVEQFSRPEMQHRWLITASGLAGIGDPNTIRTRQLSRNIILCGDMDSGAAPGTGLMAPRVMVAAGHQATAVLRILTGRHND